ncbi:MAG: ubiquinone/menaquinone biosynthesis protein [Candidatus Fischerbacteria bacterium RBG_13_37_8]|uniref:Arsenite methyltransferase n=1 Tax=Candidatus Fischerbacteria bacterium RBG_13_37_8 TaxID=1817863 RepID=A0A1F5VXA8_9BACT|nr:MAG: ubiquinone/menaquinone biosynthesis protein [Candidatus Fischerbacteria bacterium RBG_13_37_8]
MTPQMIDKATKLAEKNNYVNVEFKLAEIEELPVEDNSVDVIISNCVINLSIDKASVFKESYRVLKHNGRMMISDIVLTRELPDFIKNSMEAYANCISGALLKDEYIKAIKDAGFRDINIIGEKVYPFDLLSCDPVVAEFLEDNKVEEAQLIEIASTILSIQVAARK